MLQCPSDFRQEGVSSTDDKSDVGLHLGLLGEGEAALDPRGIEVSLVVMDTEEGDIQGEGQRLSAFESDQQGGGKARSLSRGDRVQCLRLDTCFLAGRFDGGEEVFEVFPCGQFRHDTAVFGVDLKLCGDAVRHQAAVDDDGRAGFIARTLEGEDVHELGRGLDLGVVVLGEWRSVLGGRR